VGHKNGPMLKALPASLGDMYLVVVAKQDTPFKVALSTT
jgi:hypothetical protein